jgi:hypothetical protein
MGDLRIDKIKYNPSDRPAEAYTNKQQAKKKFPPILGGFESVVLPKTGYIPFSSDAAASTSHSTGAGRI